MFEGPRSPWFRYGMALLGLATTLALLLKIPVNAIPPVALGITLFVAWFGGLWPSMALLLATVLIATPRLSTSGDLFRMVVYATDAALVNLIIAWFWREHSRAEAEAADRRATELRYRMLFEETPDPLWVVAPRTLAILECNEAATRQYGYTPSEFNGLTLNDLRASPEGRARVRVDAAMEAEPHRALRIRADTPASEGVEAPAGVIAHRRKDGSSLDVDLSSRPIQGKGLEAGSLLVLGRDVSERLKAEAELDRAKREAEAANRAKDRFLAVLSHELRTPLTPVLLACSALLDGADDLAPEIRQTLDMIRRNVELTSRLVADLLDVTRISRGKMTLDRRRLSLNGLIRESLLICESDLQASKVRLEVDLRATRDLVDVDPARLQQVLWNVVKNAVKFTPAGGLIRVRTLDGDGPRSIRVEVSDDGAGLAPEALARIFEPFHQESGPGGAHGRGGLGLGLAISRGIVEAHGGLLQATSAGLGRGATFSVELATAAAELDAPAPGLVPAADPRGRSLKLLVVDDHADTVRVISALLERAGHRVTRASSLGSAREAALAGRFDLLLCDIGLADGSGLDLMRELAPTGLRGIALSGFGTAADVASSLEAGFVAHLTKPVRWNELIRQIDDAVPAIGP
ncbi:ATP-binding protein [Isosphaeraceae bacterium EP7]